MEVLHRRNESADEALASEEEGGKFELEPEFVVVASPFPEVRRHE